MEYTQKPELQLVHYYSPCMGMYQSITATDEPQKNNVICQLQTMSGIGFNRFRKANFYLRVRRETEEWLYQEFVKSGGEPKTKTPLYFVFGESPHLSGWYGIDTASVKVRLTDISDKNISFTLKDSLMTYILDKNHPNRYVFNKQEILHIINGSDLEDIYHYYHNEKKYIEAQVWHTKNEITAMTGGLTYDMGWS